jgi:hypothetical protein
VNQPEVVPINDQEIGGIGKSPYCRGVFDVKAQQQAGSDFGPRTNGARRTRADEEAAQTPAYNCEATQWLLEV